MSCNFTGGCVTATTGTAPSTFATALNFFAAAQCLITEDWPVDANVQDKETFDFIIVGAGTSGSIVANRLSEVSKWKILLIEAGGDPPLESIIPYLSGSMYKTKYDWQYKTVNNGITNKANINGSMPWPRGKMLGGCSSINAMIYLRGSDQDYQAWYDEGNEEWHPDVVRKYFEKAENLQDASLLEDDDISDYYGHSGPLIINTMNNTDRDDLDKFLEAYDEIGITTVPDLTYANVLGSGIQRVTAYNGRRESTAKAYLNPIKNRTNLKILKNTLVTRLLFNQTTNAINGVEVDRNNTTMSLFASNEVILSAGVINTPQILMLSGLGPKNHLTSKNITTIVNLPMVGQNLQDHTLIPVPFFADEPGVADPTKNYLDVIKYLYNGTGYLAQFNFADISAMYSPDESFIYPLFQNHFVLFPKNSTGIRSYFARFWVDSVVEGTMKQAVNCSMLLFTFNHLHPYSRGNITLNSKDPKDRPLINPNYFGDKRDLDESVTGIKMLTEIVDSTYFQSINAFLGRMSWPECDKYELDSKDYWKCICVNMVLTIYHPVGSAKMGTNATTAVVNSRLKVYGVTGLRVVDASIMPTTTSGNTYGPCIMIAERASDLIKEDYKIIQSIVNS